MPETIQEAKARHEERLMALPGVVSVGIGLDAHGKPAIIVGLVNAKAKTSIELPRTVEGYPVVTQIVGPARAQ